MTTETLSQPSPITGVGHRGPESSEVDTFRDVVEDRNKAENDPSATTPEDSFVPSLDVTLDVTLAKEKVLETPPPSEQKDAEVEKAPLSPTMPSEEINMADDAGQSQQEHDMNEMCKPSSEQLTAEDTSSLLAREEEGSHLECHDETPDALAELQNPATASISEEEEEEEEEESRQQPHSPERDPAVPVDSPEELEDTQEAKGSPPAHEVNAPDFSSEQQNSLSISSELDLREETSIPSSHDQLSSVDSGSLEEAELASGQKEGDSNEDTNQATYDAVASPEPPSTLLSGTNSPNQADKGDCYVLASQHLSASTSPVESQETSPAASIQEDINSGFTETPGNGEEESQPTGPVHPSLASEEPPSSLQEDPLQKDSGDSLHAIEEEEEVSQETTCLSEAPPSPELPGPQVDSDPSSQQRAAGTDCEIAAPQPELAPSPVATAELFGPAHQGLAAECEDGHAWEGRAIQTPSGGGDDNNKSQVEVGGEAVLDSEEGEEAAAGAVELEATKEPEGVEDLLSAKDLARELPGLESPIVAGEPSGPKEPPEAMVLASVEEPQEARDRADSQDLAGTTYPVTTGEHSGPNQVPREGLVVDTGEPAELACSTLIADEPSGMDVSDYPTEWTGSDTHCPETPYSINETPIEREIRLHLEREELLRRERGLASPWGTQEYVEVRIRPILNQSGGSSTVPKEKERQWAGVQMQREIQRECQREEDLMQLGKVRGAYDRGTPIELQEKKMMFEQHFSPEALASKKLVSGGSPDRSRGPSFTEVNRATNMVIMDSGPLLHSRRPQLEKTSSANPFFCLRAKSPQSLLEQEVQEAQERERELQRLRYNLYGSALSSPLAETAEQEEEVPTQPERPSCKKLEVTWPPPSSSETSQPERSPRTLRRQRSALIERWESGAVGKQENED